MFVFQNQRLEGEVEKNEKQIEKYKSDMKKIETENKVQRSQWPIMITIFVG